MCAIEIKLPNNERRYVTEYHKITILGADGKPAAEAVATEQGFTLHTRSTVESSELVRGDQVLLDNGIIFKAIHTVDALNLAAAQEKQYWSKSEPKA